MFKGEKCKPEQGREPGFWGAAGGRVGPTDANMHAKTPFILAVVPEPCPHDAEGGPGRAWGQRH